ncbi:helix-turn-helix domain-containing protein [Dyella tabacisoli]|uniref:AraC family transcriptional regulator n=1 Tax=Dyella tabacisoli TaxID=2282381 RepID=A0A369UYE2_9GAMM|nr:helix-turn-helix domain-containing protein [Dyella tabacisoli]RDD83359.1 AraC family transcriptional regulator [Dyella tabacisoli]
MGFCHRLPAAPLDGLIEAIWDWDMAPLAHHYERVLPSLGAGLIINLHEDETRVYSDDAARTCSKMSGAVIGGPGLHSQIIDTAEQIRVMGVVFRPGGAHALCGEDHRVLVAGDINLDDMFGSRAHALRQRLLHTPQPAQRLDLLEQWLHRQLHMPALNPIVSHALAVLRREPQWMRIAPLVLETGLSEYRFGRLFRQQVGMGPKQFARLTRFRAVVDQVQRQQQVDWSRVAADGGYSDQAHLTHEFRAFAGMTPTVFVASHGAYANHIPLD